MKMCLKYAFIAYFKAFKNSEENVRDRFSSSKILCKSLLENLLSSFNYCLKYEMVILKMVTLVLGTYLIGFNIIKIQYFEG